jgi:hypothetical protein
MEESPLARNWFTASTEKSTEKPMRVRKDFKATSQASSCGTSAISSTSFSPASVSWEGGVLLLVLVLFHVRVQRLEGLCLPISASCGGDSSLISASRGSASSCAVGSMPSPSPPPPPGPLASVPGSVPRAWNRKRQAVKGQFVRLVSLCDKNCFRIRIQDIIGLLLSDPSYSRSLAFTRIQASFAADTS